MKENLSVTAADKFYDAIATSLDLPRFASVTLWQSLGREIAPSAYARGVLAGVVVYGIEATYILRDSTDEELIALQTRPQHEPASVEEEVKLHIERKPCTRQVERKRPPLAYFSEAKRFNNFEGYAVSHLTSEYEARPFRDLSLDGPASYRVPKVL